MMVLDKSHMYGKKGAKSGGGRGGPLDPFGFKYYFSKVSDTCPDEEYVELCKPENIKRNYFARRQYLMRKYKAMPDGTDEEKAERAKWEKD